MMMEAGAASPYRIQKQKNGAFRLRFFESFQQLRAIA
jgi:hypothetical protein